MELIKISATHDYGLILFKEKESYLVEIFHPKDYQINSTTDSELLLPFDYHHTSNVMTQLVINMDSINGTLFSIIKLEKETDFDLIQKVCEALYGR